MAADIFRLERIGRQHRPMRPFLPERFPGLPDVIGQFGLNRRVGLPFDIIERKETRCSRKLMTTGLQRRLQNAITKFR
jgi:hypothetical protein